MASYLVSYNVAETNKPHKVAEEMMAMRIINDKNCSLKVSKKLELVPLSNNVIQSQICDLNSDILDQVNADIKGSPLKISQLYEQTDFENCSQLIALVRYVHDGT